MERVAFVLQGTGEDDMAIIGKPYGSMIECAFDLQLASLAAAGRKDGQLGSDVTEHQFSITRKRIAKAIADFHRRRSVGAAQIHPAVRSAAFAGLVEEDRSAVCRQVGENRPVEPGHVALGRFTGRLIFQGCAPHSVRKQDAAGRGDVVKLHRSGQA